jgi:hypothetical protein
MTNVKTDRATGSAAVAYAKTFDDEAFVREIRYHMGVAAGAETLTVSLDAQAGSAYDCTLGSQAMNTLLDYYYRPEIPLHFVKGDILKITFANSGNRTWGIEVKYE